MSRIDERLPAIVARMDALVSSGVADLLGRDAAFARAIHEAKEHHYRADIGGKPSPYAAVLVHQLATAMQHGTAKPRRRTPKQNYPHQLEARYGDAIVAIVGKIRTAYEPLLSEIPKLLARAQASRGDDAGAEPTSIAEDVTGARMMFRDANEERTFAGLPIVIENPVGSFRSWIDSNGVSGFTLMKFAYGYIAGTLGQDGDALDVYLGAHPESPWVYIVNQNHKTGGHDEQKVMLGFLSADQAKHAYLAQYDDPSFFGSMTTMSLADFTAAARDASTGAPIAPRLDAPSELELAKRLLDEAGVKSGVIRSDIEDLAGYFAKETSKAQRAQLAKQLSSALGIDVLPDESFVPELIEYFTHENATLISGIPEVLHREVANLTARAFTKRMDPETFAQHLAKRFDVAESRARFIARDQLGKLWGQLNAVRQRGIGVTKFIWSTMGDERVRPMHEDLEGKKCDYDNPPVVNPAGDRLLPGEDYNCRCDAIPDLSDIVAKARGMVSSGRKYQFPSDFAAGR